MHVVVTAGHVDHGKSTLVRALTGQEPDRLTQERRRGLSIELGYVWTTLTGVGEVAFVDVPGHQRFVTTALAGMGPVPVALLVVAADDAWMPQAGEHLAALDALGVDRGLLVVTRADLADPEPIRQEARRQLSTTTLVGVPDVVVSARTGAGLDDLRRALVAVLTDVPAPDPTAPVRLWVDRRFHVRGTGTVVTGTLTAGTIAAGEQLDVVGAQGFGRVRVRGVEALGIRRDRVSGVARVALDLGGRAPTGLTRGDTLITPGALGPTSLVDVRLTGEQAPPQTPVLHVGSASQQVRVRRLGAAHARLRLDPALPLAPGDRAVLRDPGSRIVWGVTVLDVAPPPLTRRGAAAVRAAVLTGGDLSAPAPLTRPSSTGGSAGPEAEADRSEADQEAIDRLRAWFGVREPFAAPTAEELAALDVDDGVLVRLHRSEEVLRVAPGIVLGAEAAADAARLLHELEAPFTTSAARQALGTSRRVVLPLLAHLDRTGRTVRLADDTRRLRR